MVFTPGPVLLSNNFRPLFRRSAIFSLCLVDVYERRLLCGVMSVRAAAGVRVLRLSGQRCFSQKILRYLVKDEERWYLLESMNSLAGSVDQARMVVGDSLNQRKRTKLRSRDVPKIYLINKLG